MVLPAAAAAFFYLDHDFGHEPHLSHLQRQEVHRLVVYTICIA